jgi:hypothetical protein
MSEDFEIHEPRPLKPIYVDGFGQFTLINGVLRCTGFTISESEIPGLGAVRTAQVKLIVSLAGADQAQMETQRILREKPATGSQIWRGERPAH